MEDQQPRPKLRLSGTDGNAFSIMGHAMEAMRKAKCSKEHIDKYYKEATSGDYDHLLRVTMTYCDVT